MKGYTRTSALGPISDFVEARGGSIERMFSRADLPLSLLDNPDLPLPLSEQFSILREGGRELGDAFFGASLGQLVSMEKLSAFGAWVSGAPTLASAIDRSRRGLNRFMQTATLLELRVKGNSAIWSIEFLDPGRTGRFQNELLGVSYLIDGIRYFAGPRWRPDLIHCTCQGAEQARQLEHIFNAPVKPDARVCAVAFDMALLAATGPKHTHPTFEEEPPIPPSRRVQEDVAALSAIALLERQPKIDWVAGKLDMSRRTLQRALEAEGCSFSDVLEGLLQDRAITLLRATNLGLTDIALQLGYSDGAHFSRAFRRWMGIAPSQYRAQTHT
ncbi:AraC family transcriptional regulator [Actibacterium atlanticum]|uniref:AraC family transcriptional regulator n=1 Tax=Actibacterium atlanticum TaxID=1461693 RepID=A0A058ZM47_9RHOB|nr:AraC family transcriptional regulator [Actibacterium atlanticum]KCV82285.1 AraC family transcriptional regulator [Actibacterium atlanticum]